MRKESFIVSVSDAGKRLDQILAAHIPDLSRRQARVLLDIGGVFVDGARVKVAGRMLRPGQRIEAHLGGALERATKTVGHTARARDAAALPRFTVVHEDAEVIVIDKPAGLLTAPTPESDRTNLLDLITRRSGQRVFLVHRIDLQTSGLLVFAKTEAANRSLADQFRRHDVDRTYLAVVAGAFPADVPTVTLPVRGRHAVTHFEIVEHLGADATVLRCRLETGRTHQIRIHCHHLGHPVLGDPMYGEPMRLAHGPPRMALHAAELGFTPPRGAERLRFASPWPPDLTAWIAQLRTDTSSS